ncbi:MAG TPA: MFS transporter [Dictyobacter sp.]|jgi:FSR family fosmidomycin resistance protein-like MFS transporter|nr:MFS transporter [Dictyobacter sp.]
MHLPFQISRIRLLLFATTLLIEMISAFPTIGLPLLRDQVHMNYTQIGVLFSVGALASMVLEPLVNVLSDLTVSKKYWVIGAMIVLAGAFLLAGLAHSFILLLVAFAFLYPANDIAEGVVQTSLVDHNPSKSTHTLTRLAYFGNMGDFLAPVTVAIIAFLLLGWFTLCSLAALVWFVVAGVMLFQPFPKTRDGQTKSASRVIEGLRMVYHNPRLLCWVIMAIFPIMLDEVFRSFAGLYLQDMLHMSDDRVEVLLAFETGAGFVGLILTEVLLWLRVPKHWLLLWSAVIVFFSMGGLLVTRENWVVIVMLCLIGAGSIAWFPLAKAQVYDRLPGYSGTGRALLSLGAPFEVILPSVVGFIAGAYGIVVGVGFLTLAPLGIILMTVSGLAREYRSQAISVLSGPSNTVA